jgi:hypothetical protein
MRPELALRPREKGESRSLILQVESLAGRTDTAIILDLDRVSFMDSAGGPPVARLRLTGP